MLGRFWEVSVHYHCQNELVGNYSITSATNNHKDKNVLSDLSRILVDDAIDLFHSLLMTLLPIPRATLLSLKFGMFQKDFSFFFFFSLFYFFFQKSLNYSKCPASLDTLYSLFPFLCFSPISLSHGQEICLYLSVLVFLS